MNAPLLPLTPGEPPGAECLPVDLAAALQSTPGGRALMPLALHLWEHLRPRHGMPAEVQDRNEDRRDRCREWLLKAARELPDFIDGFEEAARRALAWKKPQPPWSGDRFGRFALVMADLKSSNGVLPLWLAVLGKAHPDLAPHLAPLSEEDGLIAEYDWKVWDVVRAIREGRAAR